MRVQDQTEPGAIDRAELMQMLAAAVPPGPCDHELMSLAELALRLALIASPVGDLSESKAGELVCAALSGKDGWKGRPPGDLTIWRRWTRGPQALSREPLFLDGTRYPSAFEAAFSCYCLPLICGRTLADIPEAERQGQPNPRFLAVVRVDALRAFGITETSAAPYVQASAQLPDQQLKTAPGLHLVEQPASAGAGAPVDAFNCTPTAAEDASLRVRRRCAVDRLRTLYALQTKRARQTVADEFGIDVRTVGKWLEKVTEEEAAARKDGSLSAGLNQLTCA